jgi:hypothetical protein
LLAPYLTDDVSLARIGAYMAHGDDEGRPGDWDNWPSGEHAVWIIGDYRKKQARQQAVSQVVEVAADTARAGVDAVRAAGLAPTSVLAIAGVGIVLLVLLKK